MQPDAYMEASELRDEGEGMRDEIVTKPAALMLFI
jgi:hypothetical protein